MVPNCLVRQARTSFEIKIVIASKSTELTHGNPMSPKKVLIFIFLQQSLCRDKLCNVIELAESYPRMKTILKSYLTLLRAKNGRKSVNNVSLGTKSAFFDILNCGGNKTGWSGFVKQDDR